MFPSNLAKRIYLFSKWLNGIKLLLRGGPGCRNHFAFLFSEPANFPPDIHDIKVYYITQEMIRRGLRVSWIYLGETFSILTKNGITFAVIPRLARRFRRFSYWSRIALVTAFCKAAGIRCVCVDDWLFYRGDVDKFAAYQIALKSAGIKFVFDQRDPYIDFQISNGKLEPNSSLHGILTKRYREIYRSCDLAIVPSHAYEKILIGEEGVAPNRVLGTFRGVDSGIFKPGVEPVDIKAFEGGREKFIIGWFGIMQPYRQIREILVPLISDVWNIIPNAHVVVGGDGPERLEFAGLSKRYSKRFSMVGFVPYSKLPGYIAACDVLLCPVDTRFRFSRTSIWLKIFETLAVGRPIIATRTDVTSDDLSRLRGVIWVDGSLESYLDALSRVHSDYPSYRKQALEQARNFDDYMTSKTMHKIVNRIQETVR